MSDFSFGGGGDFGIGGGADFGGGSYDVLGNLVDTSPASGDDILNSFFGAENVTQPSEDMGILDHIVDVAGKVWTLPNTVIGTAIGLAGVPFGADVSFGNNAIQFENYPWGDGALTLGNSIIYGGGETPDTYGSLYGSDQPLNVGLHEEGHTYQYQALGPLFLPSYALSGGISGDNSFEQAANDYAAGGSWWPW